MSVENPRTTRRLNKLHLRLDVWKKCGQVGDRYALQFVTAMVPYRMNIVTYKNGSSKNLILLATLSSFVYQNILQSLMENVSAVSVTVVSCVNFFVVPVRQLFLFDFEFSNEPKFIIRARLLSRVTINFKITDPTRSRESRLWTNRIHGWFSRGPIINLALSIYGGLLKAQFFHFDITENAGSRKRFVARGQGRRPSADHQWHGNFAKNQAGSL